ncbi:penicillin-binding protein 2 [Pseudooceanicola sediminis]|uniref:Penicillin-binding protein 2 n=1 Tax=Pseudooceanicola sediminis TaxID=2211117 RepID=A0A399J1D0_9RHOB|nr:penicillin-binding protein 2 [Pseudooceanicola sediminis]KAA2316244.1 penicillin-binding protein 2 [Puniceibacterium sp. HSS470]RII39155.1 penicillin-binding protein 2 [Pseudooceanicola sediminis]|tara:strand:+ start:2799 stop:4580 length:1782 start_codon:yes stop_codon:yes gene_type:complete
MNRIPLRPLARILQAREKGENPDAIERENLRLRHEAMRDRARARAEGRLLVLGLAFVCAFATVGARMGTMASSTPEEPRASARGAGIVAQRGDILDRDGRILATNMETYSLYAHPHQMIYPANAARELAKIFPELDAEKLEKRFTGNGKFYWIRRTMSPEQRQAVHDIGDPGLLFGPREMRLYPNGPIAAHILGGTSFGTEDVSYAEIKGTAGIEHSFDAELRDPANGGKPLQLSLDLTVQAALEQVLDGGMKLMNAKGASAVLMDVHTGEIVSMASLPDFDPNDRPHLPTSGHPDDSPLFDRSVQGVYELGSVFKIFTIGQALELGLVSPDTVVDIRGPIRWGRFRIGDDHYLGKEATVSEILIESSNIGTARIAQMIGAERQQQFLHKLGFFVPSPVELSEAAMTKPNWQTNWSDLTTMTVSYGHGMSISPLQLATAYAAVANGGRLLKPTLLKQAVPQDGERVMSEATSAIARQLLRKVVTEGTASFGEVPGYDVGGKTGSANKLKPTGGYYDDKTIATFASIFPIRDPKYALIVMLDEPSTFIYGEDRRTAGWTTVPVAAEIIRRIGPLLGLRPYVEPQRVADITLTSN